MHGVFIDEGVQDWQIVQQREGYGILKFSGTFCLPEDYDREEVRFVRPQIRVLSESDNFQVIPWMDVQTEEDQGGISGKWSVSLQVPAGGLYKIETGIKVNENCRGYGLFRGDVRLHIGVGDLFVIAGQSNAAGFGKDWALDPPELGVHLYRNRKCWDLACHPMNESTEAAGEVNAERRVSGTSPYLAFARKYKEISGYPVGLIMTALGGQPIRRWDTREEGDLYRNMMERIDLCGGLVSGILWYQGCSDATEEDAPVYLERFLHVVSQVRSELGYQVPFFTYQLNRWKEKKDDRFWGMIREAQRQAAHRGEKIYILPTLDAGVSDVIHNNAMSNVMLGQRMARMCGGVLRGKEAFFAPDLLSAEWKDGAVILTFAHLKKSFISVEAEEKDFCLQDRRGKITVKSVKAGYPGPNQVSVIPERAPQEEGTISYGWEADPTENPLTDEVTCMPVLAFYNVRIDHTDGKK